MSPVKIGVLAPSSVVSPIELQLGVKRLTEEDFEVVVDPQCKKKYLYFAGTHSERAEAFFRFVEDPSVTHLWFARGGYGVLQLLPLIQKRFQNRKPPQKTLLGYSDATPLLHFVQQHWGWETIHCSMPGGRMFHAQTPRAFQALVTWLKGGSSSLPFQSKLKYLGNAPAAPIEGSLIGGNLSLWASLMGTSFQPDSRGKILFFEEIGETLPKIDRMVEQIFQARGFEGVKAIVLGEFFECEDRVPVGLKQKPSFQLNPKTLKKITSKQLVPLRPRVATPKGIAETFKRVADQLSISVAMSIPVGHGPGGQNPLPLGVPYRLHTHLELHRPATIL